MPREAVPCGHHRTPQRGGGLGSKRDSLSRDGLGGQARVGGPCFPVSSARPRSQSPAACQALARPGATAMGKTRQPGPRGASAVV